MTGITGAHLNSVLPMNAQCARIAAGGSSVPGYFKTGQEPDGLDVPEMAGRHVQTSAPRLQSVTRSEPQPNISFHHN